jgi:pyridoxamine 5'-phosphate oxidase
MPDSARSAYFGDLRESYTQGGLGEENALPDPLEQFQRWFDDAVAAQIREPNAMTLATVDADGFPDARIVLLKDLSRAGFSFFTNYESAKGRQLAGAPQATLVFFWATLERQVRVRGDVTRVSREESAEYFRTRPRQSQLGAWASRQSETLPSRQSIEEQFQQAESRFAGGDVDLPPHWGGYRLAPQRIEFWQGRPNRLHDRLQYRKQGTEWIIERLSP